MLRIFPVLLILILGLFAAKTQAFANPDDLLIKDDGMVILIVSDSEVLASQSKSQNKKESKPPAPTKAVPVTSPHTESRVNINPSINNDKKVQVIITPTPQAPRPTSAPLGSSATTPSITKTVDQVVAQGSNGKTVFTIKSDQANQLTIRQGNTNVSTSLPLQIDTATHSISVPSSTGNSKVSVLPSEVIKGIIDSRVLNTNSLSQAKIDLTKDVSGINYTLNSQESKKLFGLNIKYPVTVKLSAENGKVVNVSKPILFSLFGNFLK